ncbi:MAG: response regulator [Casimicrobiaceae bacterium]
MVRKVDRKGTEKALRRTGVRACRQQGDMAVTTRVLVLEDDVANRETLCALLAQIGHGADPAASGEDALRLLANNPDFGLIISDVVMPGMGGIEFARRAREVRPGVPIVLVTGDADAIESVIADGAIALLKPYSIETLCRVVAEALEPR